ncbi:glycosyltransferase family 2 protein [Actinotalea ferrariae]|uniref:glycosyltransferase family 2 protein n=1 Tax=Actinotalea ferrariae TaxID=1386098 RepID=UPI001C1E36A3|nr:glycosyltransferase family 2 protein [Actinotalea ferrariae]
MTFEITVSPTDWRHAVHVLPHQLRQWAGQVDDVQLTLNLLQVQGRYGAAAEGLAVLRETLDDLCHRYPNAHVIEVDYSEAMQAEVGARFFDGRPFPLRNHDGGPFYSYFFGWHAARNDLVLHADSDMLFGGGSQTWIAEALALMRREPDVLCTAPLPGPPTPDRSLPERIREQHARMGGEPQWMDGDVRGYRLHGCSTRLWLFDRATLSSRLHGMPLERPRLRSAVRARLEGHPPFELPERSMSRRMNDLGLRRIDFLGTGPGMWSLHPTMRSEIFYDRLPSVIARVEAGDMPAEQLGDYNINDSLVDWSTARRAQSRQTWYRRLARRAAAQAVGGIRRALPRR